MATKIVTGERYIPESNDTELELEHWERYYAVSSLVSGKKVLDAACGEGYGSNLLAEKASSVIGVDIDKDTISDAKNKYKKKNLNFIAASVENLSFLEDNSIDVVISFETIEHISEELQNNFLKEIKRILSPNGFLVMSSPNKKEYTDRYGFHNRFHIHEMYIEEFEWLLGKYFRKVILYRQYLEVASFIDRADIDENNVDYHKDRNRYNPDGKYVIAIAGDSSLPANSLSMVSLYPEEHYLKVLDTFNDYKAEIENELKLSKEELERRAVELDARMQKISELEHNKAELKNELKLTKEELERRAVELDARMQKINELERDEGELKNELKLSKEELDRRAVELDARMQKINELEQDEGELKNELKLSKEELDRRAVELDARMQKINELEYDRGKLKEELEQREGELDVCKQKIGAFESENLWLYLKRKKRW